MEGKEISKIKIVTEDVGDKQVTRDTIELPSAEEAEFIAKAAHVM